MLVYMMSCDNVGGVEFSSYVLLHMFIPVMPLSRDHNKIAIHGSDDLLKTQPSLSIMDMYYDQDR